MDGKNYNFDLIFDSMKTCIIVMSLVGSLKEKSLHRITSNLDKLLDIFSYFFCIVILHLKTTQRIILESIQNSVFNEEEETGWIMTFKL